MFGIGTTEFLVIIVVAVLVLGPEHLPRIMRTFTKVMSDFRRVSTEFQRTINLEANQEEWQREQASLATKKKKKKAASGKDAPSVPAENGTSAEPADELAAEQTVASSHKDAPSLEKKAPSAVSECNQTSEAGASSTDKDAVETQKTANAHKNAQPGTSPSSDLPIQGGRA